MSRKTLIASILAAALALLPAAPVMAAPDGDDYARILLGLLAAGAIANALQNERERDRARAAEAARRTQSAPGRQFWDHPGRGHAQGRRHGQQRHGQQRFALPARCEFQVRTRSGRTTVLGKTCLEREGVRTARLPERCAFDVRVDGARRTVFGQSCLRDYGYRVEAGRR